MAQKNTKYDFRSVGLSRQEGAELSTSLTSLPISIKTPVRFDSSGKNFFSMHVDQVDAIKDNLRNLIACDHGSRLLMGDFGANLTDVISLLGTEDGDSIIMNRISDTVSKFMPFVALAGYDPIRKVDSEGNVSRLAMTLTFTVPSYGSELFSIDINMYEAK